MDKVFFNDWGALFYCTSLKSTEVRALGIILDRYNAKLRGEIDHTSLNSIQAALKMTKSQTCIVVKQLRDFGLVERSTKLGRGGDCDFTPNIEKVNEFLENMNR